MRTSHAPLGLVGLVGLVGLARCAAAVLVYATSYAGTLTSLNLTLAAVPAGANASTAAATITTLAVDDGCGAAPSWLTLDKANGVLYCLNENYGRPNGSLSAYKTSDSGKLTPIKTVDTPVGPVAAVFYGADNHGLALAEYESGSVSSYVKDPAELTQVENLQFHLDHVGANATRQTMPHPHETVVDPTGAFLLVPDLGSDLVHVFRINQTSLAWTPVAPLQVPPGTGPRHAAFVVTDGGSSSSSSSSSSNSSAAAASSKTFLYLTSELANTISGYEVTYNANQTLSFARVFVAPTHGIGTSVPAAAAAAEVHASPDQRFVLVSTRNDRAFNITGFDLRTSASTAAGLEPSDSIATFSVDPAMGTLALAQLFPCGGLGPRQFSLNKAGTMVGVGLQGSGRAAFIHRDVATGHLTEFAGAVAIAGQVTAVVFDE